VPTPEDVVPTYEYACRECDEHLEVHQSFTDAPLTECPACGGPLRKVFGNIAITFKGSGFYKTDSRDNGKKGAKAKDGDGTSKGEKSDKSDGSGSSGSGASGSGTSGSGKSGSGTSGSSSSSSDSSSTASSGSSSSSSGAPAAAAAS
jgi:putative FmdB family regulatory protein